MSKLILILIFISVSSLMVFRGESRIDRDFPKFRVYLQEYSSGPNATIYEVARANITANSPTSFGLVRVADDLMTSGPGLSSMKLGRAQGTVVNTGLTEPAVELTFVFAFTAGKYSGSTITVTGRKDLSDPTQELPVVGGTGMFRFVRGYTISFTYSFDPRANLTVFYYEFYVQLMN